MSSGHTSRGGRGNRRARRGSQRQRGPEGQSGQPRQNAAMLLVSQEGRQPAHTQRDADAGIHESEPDDDLGAGVDAVDAVDDTEELASEGAAEAVATNLEAVEAGEVTEPSHREAAHEHQERKELSVGEHAEHDTQGSGEPGSGHSKAEKRGPVLMPPGSGPRGPMPYAPGTRAHMAPQENTGQNGADPAYRAPGPSARTSRFERDRDHGEHEPLRPEVRGDVGPLIDSLRDVFVQDRSIASQGGTTRCGICYLHFPIAELEYREDEGYYVCTRCARSLGHTRLPMVRRQQRS